MRRLAGPCLVLLSAPVFIAGADNIQKVDGTTVSGQVVGVSGGQVMLATRTSNGGTAKFGIPLSFIKTVDMAEPPAIAQAQTAAPAAAVAALQPIVDQFAGLPAGWVVKAMSQLARAYSAQGQADKAGAIFAQIDSLYPGSTYHAQAVAGKAQLDLSVGKVDDALREVQPLINLADKDIAPSPSDGENYANAFLVYGKALEAQKKLPQALEAYLTVKTMFYQDSSLATEADQLAKDLRGRNPGLGVQ